MRKLELLAPAKNLACGIAAINHGADAVYIGANRFGARVAAGNSLADIEALCSYAHQFGAKVYVTINTIIYEEELAATRDMICHLAAMGTDALLVQDMAVIEIVAALRRENAGMKLPALHASTQTDNRTAEKVAWLKSTGFERVVLARELSAAEIAEIHRQVSDVELEVFVHGALCVSYSGVCYASQYCFHRSANRGMCAQFCRMKFDLLDANGKEIEHQRYLLSLKDMCRIDDLELLADAGACSFKIEGRLKEADYVKNVVSAYSKRLNEVIARRPQDYRRASLGNMEYAFEPDLKKTFNRGYTSYFLHGRQSDIYSPDTPKALGGYVGRVKELRNNSFNVAGTAVFSNGDGLCFINDEHELEGFRVNRVEGNRLFPLKMPAHLRSGFALYRNNDEAFGKILSQRTAVRKIPISIAFGITAARKHTQSARKTRQYALRGAADRDTRGGRQILCTVEQTRRIAPFSDGKYYARGRSAALASLFFGRFTGKILATRIRTTPLSFQCFQPSGRPILRRSRHERHCFGVRNIASSRHIRCISPPRPAHAMSSLPAFQLGILRETRRKKALLARTLVSQIGRWATFSPAIQL